MSKVSRKLVRRWTLTRNTKESSRARGGGTRIRTRESPDSRHEQNGPRNLRRSFSQPRGLLPLHSSQVICARFPKGFGIDPAQEGVRTWVEVRGFGPQTNVTDLVELCGSEGCGGATIPLKCRDQDYLMSGEEERGMMCCCARPKLLKNPTSKDNPGHL